MGETPAAERGRLAGAREMVAERRKTTLMAVIAESHQPALEPFDWPNWRQAMADRVDKMGEDRAIHEAAAKRLRRHRTKGVV